MANIFMDILFYSVAYVTLFFSVLWLWVFFTSAKKTVKIRELRPLTIIVPAYNEENNIEVCINSLIKQDYPHLKVVVVDDGSTDRTGNIAKSLCRRYRNVEYIRKENGGKASALNAGLKHVNTELFGFIDADTHLNEAALKNMAGYVYGRTAAVIASIKPYKPENIVERIQHIEYVISAFTRKIMTFLDSLYMTPGFAIYKTSVVKRLGGFDENNMTEDLEIGLRLKSNGFNIDTSLEDSAYTKVPKSFGGLFRQRMRWYRGYIYNTRKYSHVLFNRKFGDFGAVVLPMTYLVLALTIPFLLVSIYDSAIYIAQRIIDAFIINFDIKYLLSTYNLNIISPTTFFLAITFLTFLFMIRLSRKHTGEKIGKLDCFIFLITYPFINFFLWLSAFTYEAFKAKRKVRAW